MISRIIAALATVLILSCFAGEAYAQFGSWGTYSSNRFVNSNMQLYFQKRWAIARLRAQGKNQIADAMEGRRTSASGNRHQSATTTTGDNSEQELLSAPLSTSKFKSTREPSMHKRVVAGIKDLDAKQRKELEAHFLELIRSYDRLLAESNELHLKNNLAGAFNFLFLSSYYALKDGRELTDPQQKHMLQQVNAAIALRLKEQPMSDPEKQDIYESAVLSGMLVMSLYQEGNENDDQETLKTARTLAKDFLADMMGIDIEKVQISRDKVLIN